MMEQYSGDFLAAVDGLRALLGCRGRVWPVSVEPASLCAEYGDGSQTRGEVEVDAGQTRGQQVRRLWLEPRGRHPSGRGRGHPRLRRGHHRSRQLLHEPDAAAARARREGGAGRRCAGPIILIANLLTEGSGMAGFTAADAARWVSRAIDRPVDVVIANTGRPSAESAAALRGGAQGAARARRRSTPASKPVLGPFWCTEIARHDRRRLSFAVWSVLSAAPAAGRRASGRCYRFCGCRSGVFGAASRRASSAARGDVLDRAALRLPAALARRSPFRGSAPSRRRRAGRDRAAAPSRAVRISSARAMIGSNSAPVSPPCAGRFDRQMSGLSCARMSAKSPLALDAQRRELGDVDGAGPVVAMLDEQPRSAVAARRFAAPARCVRTSTHEPFSL